MEPLVSITYIRNLVEAMGEQGVEAGALLQGTGVSPMLLLDPDNHITRQACHKVLARAFALNTQPGFSLLYAGRTGPSQHGFLGHAMMCAQTVRESLKLLERFAETRGIPIDYRLAEEGHAARLTMELTIPVGHLRREYLEWGLMIALSAWSFSDQANAPRPTAIELEFDRPDYVSVYRRFFICPVRFNGARNAVFFDAAILDRPLTNSNAAIRAFCEQRCELILSELSTGGTMSDRVRTLLINSPPPFPDAPQIARTLMVSDRVLRRRLNEEGAGFRGLVQEVRERLARRYMRDATLTVKEVSRLLGYTEPPAFSRAFKKWTGLSPDRYRQHHHDAIPEVTRRA